jgi:hypothetical protein
MPMNLCFQRNSECDSNNTGASEIVRHPYCTVWHQGLRQPPSIELRVRQYFAYALLAARCDLVFLYDQDDGWPKDKLSRFAESSNVVPLFSYCMHGDADMVDANGASMRRTLVNAFELSRDELDMIHRGKAHTVLCNAISSLGTMAASRPMHRFASTTSRTTGFRCIAVRGRRRFRSHRTLHDW